MVSTLSMSSLAVIVMFMEGGSQVIPAQKTSLVKLVTMSRITLPRVINVLVVINYTETRGTSKPDSSPAFMCAVQYLSACPLLCLNLYLSVCLSVFLSVWFSLSVYCMPFSIRKNKHMRPLVSLRKIFIWYCILSRLKTPDSSPLPPHPQGTCRNKRHHLGTGVWKENTSRPACPLKCFTFTF
jgi:hypothetical protein